jgi:hypothetical protein
MEEDLVLVPVNHPNSHTTNRLLSRDEDPTLRELKDPEAICAGEPLWGPSDTVDKQVGRGDL